MHHLSLPCSDLISWLCQELKGLLKRNVSIMLLIYMCSGIPPMWTLNTAESILIKVVHNYLAGNLDSVPIKGGVLISGVS